MRKITYIICVFVLALTVFSYRTTDSTSCCYRFVNSCARTYVGYPFISLSYPEMMEQPNYLTLYYSESNNRYRGVFTMIHTFNSTEDVGTWKQKGDTIELTYLNYLAAWPAKQILLDYNQRIAALVPLAEKFILKNNSLTDITIYSNKSYNPPIKERVPRFLRVMYRRY